MESAPEVPHSDPQEDKPTKPCVGHFGSFVGQFCDGLSVSLSTYGASGVPVNGEWRESKKDLSVCPLLLKFGFCFALGHIDIGVTDVFIFSVRRTLRP